MSARQSSSTTAGSALSIAVQDEVVTLAGELDLASCSELRSAFARCSGHVDLLVVVSKLSFIDAAGIGCLVDEANHRRDRAQSLKVCEPSEHVARVLAMVDLDGLIIRPAPRAKPAAALPVPANGRLLWRSSFFSIAAFLSSSPPGVHVVADGDFSGPGSAVLHGALARVSRFRVPVVINTAGITKLSTAAAGLLDTHLNAVRGRLDDVSPVLADASRARHPRSPTDRPSD